MGNRDRYYVDRDFAETIGRRIKELREEHGHTQEYLIDHIHLGINSYETGKRIPTVMSLLKICRFYDISLYEFFSPINSSDKK